MIKQLVTAGLILGAASSLQGCVAAAAYGAYKWAQSNQHEQDQKTARACLDNHATETEFCKRVLNEMVRE